MFAQSTNSSSISSPAINGYDFDIGFGEIIEYNENMDTVCRTDYGLSYATSFPNSYDDIALYSTSDRKGKSVSSTSSSSTSHTLDRYHPENSKSEIMEYLRLNESTSGQIPTHNLMHSSEQWSNYYDLCESVKLQLHRDGYPHAKVECIMFGEERHIIYELR